VGADPYVKRLLNAQLLERVEIKGGELVSAELKPPFHGLSLLAGSNKGSLVRGPGFEPGGLTVPKYEAGARGAAATCRSMLSGSQGDGLECRRGRCRGTAYRVARDPRCGPRPGARRVNRDPFSPAA
jgi:hypothetical protein